MNQLFKKSVAEFIGATGFLTAITASSGELKIVTLALALGVLIIILRPISGAHLNPVVSLYLSYKLRPPCRYRGVTPPHIQYVY